jgi:hypothetical protein
MKTQAAYSLTLLCTILFAACSAPESARKTYSLHPKLRVTAGGSVFIQGTPEFQEFLMYQGKKDTVATVGYSRRYSTPYRSDGYNPREYEEKTQTVDATPGSVFTLHGMEQSFEIISCDDKVLVVRLR